MNERKQVWWPIVLVASLALIFFWSCSGSPSYLNFNRRSQDYYARVADACDVVRATTPVSIADGKKIAPENLSLPPVLRDLHPTYMRVTTNRVFMAIGVGRGGYGIAWQKVTLESLDLPVSRDPHPTFVQDTTMIGIGRAGGIAERIATSSDTWELRTYAESLEKVLFTRSEQLPKRTVKDQADYK